MFFSKPITIQVSTPDTRQDLIEAIQDKLTEIPYQNYVLEAKKGHWQFRFQLASIRPFGNNANALRVEIAEQGGGEGLLVTVREAYDWIIPTMVGLLAVIGISYGIVIQQYLMVAGIFVLGVLLLYYNSGLNSGMINQFRELLSYIEQEESRKA
jgi:Na+-transporting NADH:ubiquinone oxidoreductase subunit NqrB